VGAPPLDSSLRAKLVGRWTLVSLEIVGDQDVEYPMGRDVSGVIIYDDESHMAVQIMQANRPIFASGDPGTATLSELSAAVNGYVAYFGTYSVDEDARVVTHHVTGSVFPNWVGTDQRREIVLDGDRLTLDSPPLLFNGRMRVFRAVWSGGQAGCGVVQTPSRDKT
jgi:lipocalin-like protein